MVTHFLFLTSLQWHPPTQRAHTLPHTHTRIFSTVRLLLRRGRGTASSDCVATAPRGKQLFWRKNNNKKTSWVTCECVILHHNKPTLLLPISETHRSFTVNWSTHNKEVIKAACIMNAPAMSAGFSADSGFLEESLVQLLSTNILMNSIQKLFPFSCCSAETFTTRLLFQPGFLLFGEEAVEWSSSNWTRYGRFPLTLKYLAEQVKLLNSWSKKIGDLWLGLHFYRNKWWILGASCLAERDFLFELMQMENKRQHLMSQQVRGHAQKQSRITIAKV